MTKEQKRIEELEYDLAASRAMAVELRRELVAIREVNAKLRKEIGELRDKAVEVH